jgi:hypothetical protein
LRLWNIFYFFVNGKSKGALAEHVVNLRAKRVFLNFAPTCLAGETVSASQGFWSIVLDVNVYSQLVVLHHLQLMVVVIGCHIVVYASGFSFPLWQSTHGVKG